MTASNDETSKKSDISLTRSSDTSSRGSLSSSALTHSDRKELGDLSKNFAKVRGQVHESPWDSYRKEACLALLDSTLQELNSEHVNQTTIIVAANLLVMTSDSLALAIQEHEEKLRQEQLATVDELTGLPNRRGFKEIYKHVVESIKSEKLGSATLVMVDANDFKTVNDWLGHDTGDRLLQSYSSIMRSNTPASDYVFRTGGDEFMILIEHRAKKPADEHNVDWVNPKAPPIIERIQSAIENSFLTADHPDQTGVKVPMRLTFGMHNINTSLTMEQNIKLADRDLYRNKPMEKNHYDHIRKLRPLNDDEKVKPAPSLDTFS